ncbi:MAG: hypothetical protein K9M07_04800, partial [Simkaniaceae bacterium]|nr:hypothetical protein [Simkaniaceae bacterium]
MEIEMSHWIAPLSSVLPSAQPFVVASSILEGCFYSSLKQPANSDSSIITWIRETSIRNIHLIQGLFCA